MDSYDQYDILNAALASANEYPANLLRTRSFQHDLVAYNIALQQQESRLFDDDPEFSGVKLFEAYDGCEYRPLERYRTVDELRRHFQAERKDPRSRHVFITADHSRAPLDCSKEAFTYTLSFLQTMPRFLDLAFTFGEQESEKDFHYTAFNAENFLDVSEAKRHCIPRLGRSGREIRHCFNLWSVEGSETSPYEWAIRQTAAYHSFDVCTGRNVWINMKGNELMQKRITQALASTSHLQPVSLETTSGSFSASLLTLLIVLEWSGENWKSLVNNLEKKLTDILMKAKSFPIKEIEEALSLGPDIFLGHLAASEATTGKSPRRTDLGVQVQPPPRPCTIRSVWSSVNPKRILSGFSRASTRVDTEKQDSPALTGKKSSPEPLKSLLVSPTLQVTSGTFHQRNLSVLQEFSVDGLQKLTTIASKVHEVQLVMKLNAEVINEIMDYYKSLVDDNGFPGEIRTNCTADLNDFFRRARAVTRGLEMEQTRSETLMRMLKDGKSLLDNILRFRNIEINKLFAINAHESGKHVHMMIKDMHQSSLEMEAMTKSVKKVADKTATQTSSMHLITLATFLFLPATFVASRHFSAAEHLNGTRTTQMGHRCLSGSWGFFALFAVICFPMTAAIILVCWWALYWRNNGMRRQHGLGDEEQQ